MSLSTPNLNGSADYFQADSSVALVSSLAVGTISAWFRTDEVTNRTVLFSASDKSSASEDLTIDKENGTGKMEFFVRGGSSNVEFKTTNQYNDDKWHQIVVTVGTGGNAIYIDGTLAEGAYSTGTSSTQAFFSHLSDIDTLRIGNREDSGGNEYFWEDNIRDVRIYDYVLSADQVASLYSNSYNVTPKLWWKMDDGTTNIQGSGTASAHAMSGEGGIDWTDGTLDLDGTLTTSGTAFFSAPRGDLELAATTTFASSSASDTNNTFIHNDGRVVVTNAGTVTYNFSSDNAGSDNPLYDLYNDAGGQVRFGNGFIIENSHAASSILKNNYLTGGRQYNYGTTSGSAAITAQLRAALSGGDNVAKVYGVSSLHPVTMDNWDDFPMTYDVAIKNMNVTTDVTGANVIPSGRTVRLDGDCEFDAFTVENGGTLNLNGQRAEFGGNVTNSGTLDVTGSLGVFHSGFTKYGTLNNANSADIWTTASSGNPTFSYITGYKTFFQNGGVQLGTGGWSNVSTAIVAGTTLCGTRDTSSTDLTIATGGDLQPTGNTVTVSGNFTTAGGLIGKTGLYTNAIYNAQFDWNADQQWDTGASADGTIEGWYKADSFGYEVLARTSGPGQWLLLMNTNDISFYVSDNSTAQTTITATHGLSTDKWFHIACVADGTSQLMYIDGKLVASGTKGAGIRGSLEFGWALSSNPGSSIYEFDGYIHNFRIWKEARTVSEIRDNMFKTDPTDTNSKLSANINFEAGGAGGTITDAAGNGNGTLYKEDGGSHTATTDAAAWTGTGGFSGGDSTLKFSKAGTQYFNYLNSEYIAGITVNSGSTTILNDIDANNHPIYVSGNFVVSGTLDNTSQEYCRFGNNFVSKGSFDVDNGTITGISSFVNDASTTMTLTAGTYPTWDVYYGPLSLSTDVTFNAGVRLVGQGSGDPELILNGYTATVKEYVALRNDAILNIGNGTLHYDHAGGSGIISNGYTGQTLKAGPGANIKGHSSANKTTFESKPNFEIVGNIENLDVTVEELQVIGNVTNCTGLYQRWPPHFERDAILDSDTADDRDLVIDRRNDLDTDTSLFS